MRIGTAAARRRHRAAALDAPLGAAGSRSHLSLEGPGASRGSLEPGGSPRRAGRDLGTMPNDPLVKGRWAFASICLLRFARAYEANVRQAGSLKLAGRAPAVLWAPFGHHEKRPIGEGQVGTCQHLLAGGVHASNDSWEPGEPLLQWGQFEHHAKRPLREGQVCTCGAATCVGPPHGFGVCRLHHRTVPLAHTASVRLQLQQMRHPHSSLHTIQITCASLRSCVAKHSVACRVSCPA